jgi:hypothetical protein
MSLSWWLLIGLVIGAAPSWLARPVELRPWLARRWWWLAFGLVFVFLILPIGLVFIMFLSDAAFGPMREMANVFLGDAFGWLTGLALGVVAGSGAMAWAYRKAPRLQGPPLSEQVMALAGDPDKHLQAVELYERETGVGYAVAADVVEAYIAAERRRPRRQELGALGWMYSGFAAAWYAVLGVGWLLTLRESSNHFLTALAFFVFIPGLFGGLCELCAKVAGSQRKAALASALRSGALTRGFAFGAGVTAGIVSIIGVVFSGVAAFAISQGEAGIAIALGGTIAVLMAAPFLGLWLLNKRLPSNGDEPATSA